MKRTLPYFRVDENLISVDFPTKPREATEAHLKVQANQIALEAFPSVFQADETDPA
jgi:hypothetical protein